MASADDIAALRRMVHEPTTATYSDLVLSARIDAAANINAAAAAIWNEKAARYAELVDVKEGSSSRSLGDLHGQALAMAKSFQEASDATTGGSGRSRTRAIERA